jgi:hypothetical protein
LIAVAVHFTKHEFLWLIVVIQSICNTVVCFTFAIIKINLLKRLLDELEVNLSSECDQEGQKHYTQDLHAVPESEAHGHTSVLPHDDCWVYCFLSGDVTFLQESLLLEEVSQTA